jgi:hypothetical protein
VGILNSRIKVGKAIFMAVSIKIPQKLSNPIATMEAMTRVGIFSECMILSLLTTNLILVYQGPKFAANSKRIKIFSMQKSCSFEQLFILLISSY